MAIEIKELHVRLHVGKEEQTVSGTEKNNQSQETAVDSDQLVARTVKQVLRILKEMEER